MKITKDDSNCTGKNAQSCEITIKLNDLDSANSIFKVLCEQFQKAGQGGDFGINGSPVGHDVQVESIHLQVGVNEFTQLTSFKEFCSN